MENYRDALVLHFDSKYADFMINENKYVFDTPQINAGPEMVIYAKVRNFSLPNSFYQINSSNNSFNYEVNGVTHNDTIFPGNYTMQNFIDWVANNTELTCTFIDYEGKLKFTHPTFEFEILQTSTCFAIIGLIEGPLPISSLSQELVCTYPCNFNPTSVVIVNSNLRTQNFMVHSQAQMSILAYIPVDKQPWDMLTYDNSASNFWNNLNINQLSELQIFLTDNKMNPIDLNGQNFNLTIELTFVNQ